MKQLVALNQYLLSLDWFEESQLETFCESGVLTLSSKLDDKGMLIGYNQYQASVSVERYKGSAERIIAAISGWLQENDCERDEYDLADPTYEVYVLDDEFVDIDFSIPFMSKVHLIESATGFIEVHGKKWDLGDYQLGVANEVSVNG